MRTLPFLTIIQLLGFGLLVCQKAPEEAIARIVKATLLTMTSSELTLMMKHHLQHLKLYTKNNDWAHPKLKAVEHILLPKHLNGHAMAIFVDKMAENAAKNKYLHHFLLQAKGPDFTKLVEKVKSEGCRVFPSVVSYAMVLDRLVGAMRKDWKVLHTCKKIWDPLTSNITKHKIQKKKQKINAFIILKTKSIKGVVKESIEALEAGVVDPNFLSHHLPVNIFQARRLDISKGNHDNAKVGVALAREAPGGEENNCTGSGPAHISSDGNAVEWRMAFPLQWADLYQTWNMAFVSNFDNWPYYLVKLLIPNISHYQSNPGGYLYDRILGLYSHINWFWMGTLYRSDESLDIKWSIPSLSKNWGRANSESARDYELMKKKCH